jgi:hypothetical protein
MKATYSRIFTAILGAVALTLLAVPNCAAECGGIGQPVRLHSSWRPQPGDIRLLPAAFVPADDNDGVDYSIVGLWHVKFVSEGSAGITNGTEIDAGYSAWHSDHTEIMNSGSRPPSTSSFCLGVWERVGETEYKLNHFAISWASATATTLTGPTNITEDVNLSANGQTFEGTFTIVNYDEKLNVKGKVVGKITGTRITIDSPPQSVF